MTIVVLIILATISINAVLGENGMIRRAEQARQHQANAEAEDNAKLNELDGHIANAMGENGGGSQTPEEPTEPEDTTVAVTGVSLDKTSGAITSNGTLQLRETVNPNNATNKNVTWSSSTPSVATVDQTGLVTAVAVGSTTITVTTEDGAKTATCRVTVFEPMDASDIKTNASIYYGTSVYYAGQEWEIFFADDTNIYLIKKRSLTDPVYRSRNLSEAVHATRYNDGSSMLTANATKNNFPAAEKWFNWPTTSNFESTNNNMKAALFMLDSINVWNTTYYTEGITDWAIGSPTLEMLCKSVNDVKGDTNYVAAPTISYGYSNTISNGLTNGTVWNHGDCYWLACPSSYGSDYVHYVLPDAKCVQYNGKEYNYIDGFGFRPVVCLSSGITLRAVESSNGELIAFNVVEAQ